MPNLQDKPAAMIYNRNNLAKLHLTCIVIFLSMITVILSGSSTLALSIPQEKLFKVEVTGVDGEIKENILAILSIPNGMVRDGKIEPTWAKRFARQAKSRIQRGMEPFGYYNPQTDIQLKQLEDGRFVLTAEITPGEPVTIHQQDIRISGAGHNEPRIMKLAETFPLQQGAPLHHKLYEEWKGNLLETARSLGYLNADFSVHEIHVEPSQRKADVKVELDTGPRYRFGEISFKGAETIPEKILRRYLTFKQGDIYSDSKLAKTQSNLLDSDRFRNSQVKPLTGQAEGQDVPVEISLTPQPRFQLKPGVGYGTDTGARVSLRFNDKNSFKLGHEFQSELMIAELRQTASGSYLIPLGSKTDSILGLSLQYDRENNDTFETSTLASEVSLAHRFIKNINTTLSLRLSREDYEIGSEPKQSTTLVMPGATFGQRRWQFEQPGHVRQGYAWQLKVRGSSVALGSDVSALQGIIGASAVIRLNEKFKLILRAESGSTIQNDFNDLPPSLRFFAGGDQSVRGYAYKTLGPKDDQGNIVGGRHMLISSMEVERQINNDWGVAVFYDTGNAFDSFSEYELAQGAGIGIRRHTPIGPIKLDLARQIGQSDNSFRLHLSVGFGW